MINELKNNFTQTTVGSIIWIAILATIFNFQETTPLHPIWTVIAIGCIFGFIFGVIYPFLWNYSTFKSGINIAISTVLNTIGSTLAVYLFSPTMFNFIKPYIIGIVLLTLIGHTLGFYAYSKMENRKLAAELNQKI